MQPAKSQYATKVIIAIITLTQRLFKSDVDNKLSESQTKHNFL